MKSTATALSMVCCLMFASARAGEIVVIGNGNVPKMDSATIQKVYTGKFVSVSGINVTPVAVKPGSSTRDRFLHAFLSEDEEKYTAYWTVRRYIGKGEPPKELGSDAEVIQFVRNTPGAVGYIDEAELKPGLNVITRQ